MPNISFFLTKQPFLDGSKDVTRRLGWKKLKPGSRLMAVEKGQGIEPGGLVRYGLIEVVSARRERLSEMHKEPYGTKEAIREGFPKMNGRDFVSMFCSHMKVKPSKYVTRIEFNRLTFLMPVLMRKKDLIDGIDDPVVFPFWFEWIEKRSFRNHRQKLCDLRERGGLSYCECLAILEDRRWRKMSDDEINDGFQTHQFMVTVTGASEKKLPELRRMARRAERVKL